MHCVPLALFLKFNKIKLIFAQYSLADFEPRELKRRKLIELRQEAEKKTDNEAYQLQVPGKDTIILKGQFGAGDHPRDIQQAVKALVMPNVRDPYHSN